MALYLGDTEVAPVIEVPVPEKRFNIGINNLMGTVNENGMYIKPTEPFTPDFSNVKNLPDSALQYRFIGDLGVTGDIVFGFESISGYAAMNRAFYNCAGLTSVSFPVLTTISGINAMQNAFQYCRYIKSVSFPVLTTISGDNAMDSTFDGCSSLTSVSFPALTTISAKRGMTATFNGCSSLTSVSFPALTTVATNAFGASYGYTFRGCTALTEIHFRADAQATIEAVTGYADKWGATNATIYFDL